jgi:hypothetical protein
MINGYKGVSELAWAACHGDIAAQDTVRKMAHHYEPNFKVGPDARKLCNTDYQ